VRRSRGALLLSALVLLPRGAPAQRSVRVRADNDAFNFWQAPWNRPDEEYTSGVRLTVDYEGRAWWAGGRSGGGEECGGTRNTCGGHSYAFGQDIYTAVRSRQRPTPLPGARPDAGVLWLSASNTLVGPDRTTELRWTLGVTGKPALAAPMQRFFHDLGPGWNGPIDWATQLPAEPVFAVSFDQRRARTVGAFELQPHAGVSLGTLLTEARAGLGARLGTNRRPGGRLSLSQRMTWALESDVTLRGVARNEVLSGTLFRRSARVALRPLVAELQTGLHLRWRGIGLAWVAHQTGAEYLARGRTHAWSSLEAGWWPGR
jgi:hypothetical protein